MGKGYRSRKEEIRKPKRKVIIVCEGKKTEIIYFNGFKTRWSGVEIIPLHGKCTDPKNIVDFAKEEMHNWSIDLDEGDGVWCAFDVDENKNNVLKDEYEHAKTKNIQIALSNPCFELWFLLHYKQILSPISRKDTMVELKKFIKDYEKNKNINPLLEKKLSTAIKNARKLNEKHEKEKTPLIGRESNPSTQVFKLVEFIQQLIEKNKVN
ncbi:MAG: RloB domain-containing protein [Candidatus Aenigmarchaeota archaeon]|nr:RloB domain-containing protein [Candidatus Aenigmarchaeota archaeon]